MSPASSSSSRWCPTPEQIMILEEMYRGGIRTPNASQIQQITAHLSLYGKIEGKNVFYWFQNHKARDRQKLRRKLLKQLQQQHHHPHNTKLLYHQLPTYPHPHPPLAYNSSSTNNLPDQLYHRHYNLSAEFLPQGGGEEASTPWKADLREMLKAEKSTTRTYGPDWKMMMDVGPTTPRRPLKTLELFPVTATGSLKDECTTPNHFSCSN